MAEQIRRRDFLQMMGTGAAGLALAGCNSSRFVGSKSVADKPNIVIIFADDLGYGDLGCFGHPTINTPNLDRMAAEGMKLTQFYSAACVCTPSRAALMTGRLPIRNGMCGKRRSVLFPDSPGGLPASEITIAEALKSAGYATACVGKWHLGHLPKFLPTRHGFDSYYGIPYSNDMKPCPLMRNEKVIEEPAEQTTLTKRYAKEAVGFIEKNKSKPFFLYFAHTFPHVPLFASKDFKDKSLRGLYGDAVEELDWSIGQVMETLHRNKLAENTIVFFTSDNGPWLTCHLAGGSAGLLRDGKGTTWEGGMREPGIAWWPGKIKAGSVNAGLASTMDIFATSLDLAGVALPADRVLDTVSMKDMLFDKGKSHRDTMFYYRKGLLFAVRKGPWKAHFNTKSSFKSGIEEHNTPLLFHLGHDPSEKYDVAKEHPEVIKDIQHLVERHRVGIVPVESQLDKKMQKVS